MNLGAILSWVIGNVGAIVAAVMVIVRLIEAAIAAGQTKSSGVVDVAKQFFTLK